MAFHRESGAGGADEVECKVLLFRVKCVGPGFELSRVEEGAVKSEIEG